MSGFIEDVGACVWMCVRSFQRWMGGCVDGCLYVPRYVQSMYGVGRHGKLL